MEEAEILDLFKQGLNKEQIAIAYTKATKCDRKNGVCKYCTKKCTTKDNLKQACSIIESILYDYSMHKR